MSELIIFPMDSNYYSGSDILSSNILVHLNSYVLISPSLEGEVSTLSQSNWS